MEDRLENMDLLNEVLRGRMSHGDKRFVKWLETTQENRERYEAELACLTKEAKVGRELDVETLWKNVQHDLARSRWNVMWWLRYAAILVVPLGVALYFFMQGEPVSGDSPLGKVVQARNEVVLVLSDGSEVQLNHVDTALREMNGMEIVLMEEGGLVYQSDDARGDTTLYNVIRVPVTGEYTITLSDGTQVWLASASRLKYPINFTGDCREVCLEEGEAFFSVSPDREKPFIVTCGSFSVKALGTSFNIMRYCDEDHAEATLNTGSVEVFTQSMHQILRPGQQAMIRGDHIGVREVSLTPYVSWMNDRFYFSNERLDVIMRKVARWYGIDVQYKDEAAKEYHFTGNLPKYNEIARVFELLGLTTDVNFKVQDNTVIVSSK